MKSFLLTDSEKPEIIISSLGRANLFYKGHKFYKHRCTVDKIRWSCTNSNAGCKAFIYTSDKAVIKTQLLHNHPVARKILGSKSIDYTTPSLRKRMQSVRNIDESLMPIVTILEESAESELLIP